MANVRLERQKQQALNAISKIIREEVSNANIGMVTITKGELTSDLSFLTVYYNVIGNKEKTQIALRNTSGFIRSKLAKEVQMRKIPKLIFKYDDSYDKLNKVDKILNKLGNKG